MNSRLSNILPFALLFLSGGACLGWQFLWTEQLGLKLGHESIALLAVTTAFFGGSALGAWFADTSLVRKISPGKVYVLCEMIIATWGLTLDKLLPQACDLAMFIIGSTPTPLWQGSVTFFVSFLVLAPSTAAMGATLPVINEQISKGVSAWAGLYSANTIGALAGIVFVILYATPFWGFRQTSITLIGLNLICALLATWAWITSVSRPSGAKSATSLLPANNVLLALFISGFLGVGYEVVAARVLAGVTENTIFSYAAILLTYLLATALGAAWYQKTIYRNSDLIGRLISLLFYLFISTLLSVASLWKIELISSVLVEFFWPFQVAALGREFVSAALIVFMPSAVMGAVFAHLCVMSNIRGSSYATSLAINALGATFAPVLLCGIFIPYVGVKSVLVFLSLCYGLLWVMWARRQHNPFFIVVFVGVAAVLSPPMLFIDIPPGGKLLRYQDGIMATVSVTEDAAGVARLQINNRVQEGSSASGVLEARLAQIPLAFHPAPRNALFLGVGTGFTSQVAAMESALDVTAVELIPEVLDTIPFFARSAYRKQAAKSVHYVVGDARRYVQISSDKYDVIVGDLFHPARNGAGSLYTVEQFANVKNRLTRDGLYCQWLALHQMDNNTLRSIVGAFLQVYPNAIAVLANNSVDTPVIGLIGRSDDLLFTLNTVERRLNHMNDAHLLARSDLYEKRALFGTVVADSSALKKFSYSISINTDDKPLVNHLAPWTTYQASSIPKQRLAELLDVFWIKPELVFNEASTEESVAYVAYWRARNAYLKAGMFVSSTSSPNELLDKVQSELVQILKECPSFTPARVTLMQLAEAVSVTDGPRAQKLKYLLDVIK